LRIASDTVCRNTDSAETLKTRELKASFIRVRRLAEVKNGEAWTEHIVRKGLTNMTERQRKNLIGTCGKSVLVGPILCTISLRANETVEGGRWDE